MVYVFAVVTFLICAKCNGDIMDYFYSYRRNSPDEPNYNETFFSSLRNYEVEATRVTEDKYPWIARVIHSKSYYYPTVCTAVCVEDRIFITAGRCLYRSKVLYTTVLYQKHRFSALAFVVPSNKTKQVFDDIGFIVVKENDFQGQWSTAKLFDSTKRTDENFNWFADLNLPEETSEHVAVGYTTSKNQKINNLAMNDQYELTELKVIVNINICPEILIINKLITGFHVPCYHSCSVQQFKDKKPECAKYHGVLGGAVWNTETNTILGIATWGTSTPRYELPVGFSVPNSKAFYEDFICARRIKLDKESIVIDGYYQALCEDINEKSK